MKLNTECIRWISNSSWIALVLMFAIGCSDSSFDLVQPKIIVYVDEKPAEGVRVQFRPQADIGPTSTGISNKNGEIFLKEARGRGDGVVKGSHIVIAEDHYFLVSKEKQKLLKYKPTNIHPKYSKASGGLKIEVNGQDQIELKFSSKR